MKKAVLFMIPVLLFTVMSMSIPSTADAAGKSYSHEDFRVQPRYEPAGAQRTQPARTRHIDPHARPAYENGMQRHGMGGAFGSNSAASSQPKDWPSGMFGPYDFK
jgi:hypothetical protein